MGINRIRLANGAMGDPRVDARMQNTYQQNIADNQAQEAINQQNLNLGRERSRNRMQNMNRTGGLDDIGANVDVSGIESLTSPINLTKAALSVPFNIIKGAIGNPLNPEALTQVSLTQAQKQRLNEIAQAKGTATGNIDYSDYGSPTPTFSGVEGMTPLDATLATTMGGTNFRTNSDGEIEFLGGKYDFEKSDNPLLKFIDQGGISGAVASGVEGIGNLLTPSSATADQPSAMPQGSPGQLNPVPPGEQDYFPVYSAELGRDFTEEEYTNRS